MSTFETVTMKQAEDSLSFWFVDQFFDGDVEESDVRKLVEYIEDKGAKAVRRTREKNRRSTYDFAIKPASVRGVSDYDVMKMMKRLRFKDEEIESALRISHAAEQAKMDDEAAQLRALYPTYHQRSQDDILPSSQS